MKHPHRLLERLERKIFRELAGTRPTNKAAVPWMLETLNLIGRVRAVEARAAAEPGPIQYQGYRSPEKAEPHDPWARAIAQRLRGTDGVVTMTDLMAAVGLNWMVEGQDPTATRRIRAIMESLGWERKEIRARRSIFCRQDQSSVSPRTRR